ncbi:hypothetical protein NIASO_00715 [Niabella soli DSM 19437]|uniref:Uncharacterized protein n=1 Tax=Niabella soli DSM 19437 TaxID=929713 RepID=W0F209_9BACT|nr:hypothetical protein NIASO_00715 [Niabella soli DSM 19437]
MILFKREDSFKFIFESHIWPGSRCDGKSKAIEKQYLPVFPCIYYD